MMSGSRSDGVRLGALRVGDRIVVIGASKTGKSTLIEFLMAESPRAVFVTPTADDFQAPGRWEARADQLEQYLWRLRAEHSRIVVRLRGETGSDMVDECQQVRRALKLAGGYYTVAFDEVGDYGDAGAWLLRSLIRRPRHDHLAVILASQQASDIPLRCRKNASRAYLFGQGHPAELDEVEKAYGKTVRAQVARWNKGQPPAQWAPPWEN